MKKQYSPPTNDLIKKALLANKNVSISEISKYVCNAQKRSLVMISGSAVKKVKEQLGISVRAYHREKSHKGLYYKFFSFPIDNEKTVSVIKNFIEVLNKSKRIHLEAIELANPHELEIREIQ